MKAEPVSRRPLRPPLALALSLAACLSVAGACGPGEPVPLLETRWIEEDAEVLFQPDRYTEREVLFEWRLDDPEEVSAFRLTNFEGEPRRVQGGLEVPFASPFVRLVRTVDFRASDVHLIEVQVAGASRGHIQLLWAGDGQGASSERKLQVPARSVAGDVVTFDVSAEPHWSGQIRRISIAPTTAPGQTVVVKAIRGVRRQLDADALARVVSRPWKVDLGEDVRNALLAPPGVRLEKELEVPPGGLLRLAYGVLPRALEPVTFRVTARTEGDEPAMLLDRRLEPGSDPAWTDADLDLAAFAGDRVTILLETLVESEPELARMVPAWANPEVLSTGRPPEQPNVILIVIDTLRADRMSAYGHSRATTPGLEAWAGDSGIRFETVVAPSPWTLPSHVSLFTGLDAVTHGINYSAPADPSLTMLAERLRAAGYSTAAFTAGAYLSPEFGLSQGFDLFRARQEGPGGAATTGELEEGLAQVRSWLSEKPPRPFFLFFHTYEVHTPYRAREPYFERFGGDRSRMPTGSISTRSVEATANEGFLYRKDFVFPDEGKRRRGASLTAEDLDLVEIAYDSGVAYMDDQVSRFLADLAAMGHDEDTVVVFTSDHGEMLGEHDLAAHGYLYDENLRIPLILALPDGRAAGTVVSQQARLTDVFPTLLELAGLRSPREADGESLLPLIPGSPGGSERARHRPAWSYAASTNYGLSLRYDNRLKYIFRNAVWPPIRGEEELYDLQRDPGEIRNLASETDSSARFRVRAREYLESRTSGLRVRFSNPGPAVLTGTLKGSAIRAAGVTSPDLSCPCLRWNGGRTLGFEIPPGEAFTVHLEQAGMERLAIEGTVGEGRAAARFYRTVDATNLEAPFDISFDGSRWTSGPATPDAAARASAPAIRFWWEGERHARGEVPIEDAELQEQLRALGYLN